MKKMNRLVRFVVSCAIILALSATSIFAAGTEVYAAQKSTTGFKPRSVSIVPVVQDANGVLTRLSELKRTETQSATASNNSSMTFFGAGNFCRSWEERK